MSLAINIIVSIAVIGYACLLAFRFFNNLKASNVFIETVNVKKINLVWVFVTTLGFRVVSFAIMYLFSNEKNLYSLLTRWDALHYTKLIEFGYEGYIENGKNLFLVFFPLYVWFVKPFAIIFGDTILTAAVLSNILFALACVFMFLAVNEKYSTKTATLSVILLCISPFSFFFSVPITESMFLLTTCASLYFCFKKNWVIYAIFGIMAALTRMTGLFVIAPALIELINYYNPFRSKDKLKKIKEIAKKLPLIFAPISGSLAYLLLNYIVTGNPFAFIELQQHWNQGGMWISQVVEYMIERCTIDDINTKICIWYPQLILFILCLTLLFIGVKTKAHSDAILVYGFLCFMSTFSLSWLLSGGRYLSVVPSFFIIIAVLIGKNKYAIFFTCFISIVLYAFYFYLYMSGNLVM